jgi:hypothetical protein
MLSPIVVKTGILLGTDGYVTMTPHIVFDEWWVRIVDMQLRPRLFLRCHDLGDTALFREVGHA